MPEASHECLHCSPLSSHEMQSRELRMKIATFFLIYMLFDIIGNAFPLSHISTPLVASVIIVMIVI